MFVQLFLGIYFVAKGIVELYARKPNFLLSEGTILSIPKKNLSSYLKRVGIVHIFLGTFVATMGHIEYWHNPELWPFIMTYIIIGFTCLGIIVYLNKKYTGYYRL